MILGFYMFVWKIWEKIDKIKADEDRLLLVLKNEKHCNIPTFPLVARRFSQPGFGRNGGVGDGIISETDI